MKPVFIGLLVAANLTSLTTSADDPTHGFERSRATHPIGESLAVIHSPYTDLVKKLAVEWESKTAFVDLFRDGSSVSSPTVQITGYLTPAKPFYVGVLQNVIIEAPFARVRAVVDNFPGYLGIFDGLIQAKLVSEDGNLFLTEWEEHIGVPFVPNERNQVTYLISDLRSGDRIYRYGITRSNHLKASDGIIAVEKLSLNRTRYTELDFIEPDLGAAKILGSDSIWRECIEGLLQSDLALKLAAEHPDWSAREVLEKSKSLLKLQPIDPLLRSRRDLPAPK